MTIKQEVETFWGAPPQDERQRSFRNAMSPLVVRLIKNNGQWCEIHGSYVGICRACVEETGGEISW